MGHPGQSCDTWASGQGLSCKQAGPRWVPEEVSRVFALQRPFSRFMVLCTSISSNHASQAGCNPYPGRAPCQDPRGHHWANRSSRCQGGTDPTASEHWPGRCIHLSVEQGGHTLPADLDMHTDFLTAHAHLFFSLNSCPCLNVSTFPAYLLFSLNISLGEGTPHLVS